MADTPAPWLGPIPSTAATTARSVAVLWLEQGGGIDDQAGERSDRERTGKSQILDELRKDTSFPSSFKGNHEKQFMFESKKFGFIHTSLSLTMPGRKNNA
ncbi:hypothetical protein SAY86_024372 [Trapa natans]|uniref:Uncharacterized protein n=1 Tax=Trapa natans TaxID=22666 RepID=A0AAN7RDD9_TRANT|nr:hypothetical protein SAY86_024372 [Trapa natans]